MKDWIGNSSTPFACNGASNHSKQEREKNYFYATNPKAIEMLLNFEKFDKNIWECACGTGNLSKVLKEKEWLKARKNKIGGSDCAAILGTNPYKTNVEY